MKASKAQLAILVLAALASVMVLSPVTSANKTYTDIPEDHPLKTEIDYLSKDGTIQGYPDGSFKPEQIMNRAEFLKMAAIDYGRNMPPEFIEQNCFDDIEIVWYTPYVCYGKALEWVQGYPGTNEFRPTNPVNLAEALKMVFEVNEIAYDKNKGVWYQDLIDQAYDLKMLESGDNLQPDSKLTRGDFVKILARLYMNHPSKRVELSSRSTEDYWRFVGDGSSSEDVPDEIETRPKVSGLEKLTPRFYTPTGKPYIEDLDACLEKENNGDFFNSDEAYFIDHGGKWGLTEGKSACLPEATMSYLNYYESGIFNVETKRPMPYYGSTCRYLKVLILVVDTPENRKEMLNGDMTDKEKELVEKGKTQEAMVSYARRELKDDKVYQGVLESSAGFEPDMPYDLWVLATENREFMEHDVIIPGQDYYMKKGEKFKWINEGTIFPLYDAVVFLDLKPFEGKTAVGIYGGTMPYSHPSSFYSGCTTKEINLMPAFHSALFYNELIRRGNGVYGPFDKLIVEDEYKDGVHYGHQVNTRTGEYYGNAMGYMSGWMDVDKDGIRDCHDPDIAKTEDNVDGDWLPDHMDPDLDRVDVTYEYQVHKQCKPYQIEGQSKYINLPAKVPRD